MTEKFFAKVKGFSPVTVQSCIKTVVLLNRYFRRNGVKG